VGIVLFAHGTSIYNPGFWRREFFFLLSQDIKNPARSLLKSSPQHKNTFQINSASGINPEHLNHFKFIGRCMALAILHENFLDISFDSILYKGLLKKSFTLVDLESVDAELHRSMTWMLYVETLLMALHT
jgi:E3 ubiquitin-protein ligase NEDD4